MIDRCSRCDSADLTTKVAGLDWLVTCNTCGYWERLPDEAMGL